ncbi:MAG: lysophospholipid acyltransferase family protein [Planctomycetota bacterium]
MTGTEPEPHSTRVDPADAATAASRPEKLRRRLRARALRLLTRGAGIVPPRAVFGALAVVSPLSRFTRFERTTQENLARALGPTTTALERARIARGVRVHSARIFADWIRLAASGPAGSANGAWIERHVELDDSIAVLERALAAGHGALVVTAHLGNWELLAARLARRGVRGAVVGFQRRHDSTSAWLTDMRHAYGVPTVAQDAHPREILRVLARGEVVGLLADLEARRIDGESVPFFGIPAWTMTAPAALARASRAVLVPARCVRRGARYRLMFEEPVASDRSLARRDALLDVCRRLNATFERWIREDPEQWAWHQRRWRTSLQRPDQGLARA